MKSRKVDIMKTTITEQVVQLIRQAIIDNELTSGNRITETDLAETFAVSRTPIREALKILEAQGLLARINRQLVIAERSLRNMRETFQTRIALETYAVRLAANKITAKELKYLERRCDKFDNLFDQKDWDTVQKLGNDFHNAIAEYSRNRQIIKYLHNINEQINGYRMQLHSVPNITKLEIVNHRAILAAIRAHDANLAQENMREHLENSLEVLISLWQATQ